MSSEMPEVRQGWDLEFQWAAAGRLAASTVTVAFEGMRAPTHFSRVSVPAAAPSTGLTLLLHTWSGGLLMALRAGARQSVREYIGCGNAYRFNDFDVTGQASTDEVSNAGFSLFSIVGGDS